MRGGQETESARLLIDLIGSTRRSALIYYERWTAGTSVLGRFTRSRPDLDGVMEAECDRDPILSARLCRAAASRERYHAFGRSRASRGAEMTSYWTPYLEPTLRSSTTVVQM